MKRTRLTAEAAAYGSTTKEKAPGALEFLESLAASSISGKFSVVFGGSVGVFFFVVLFFTFLLFNRTVWAVTLLVFAEYTFITVATSGSKSAYQVPFSICSAIAAAVGALCGTYIFDVYGYFAFVYSRARVYENIVPTERSAAVADAGAIVFADEAHVDMSMAAGYASTDGSMYCAAPVRGLATPSQVEFWAVGVDCCSSLGSFTCDSAGDTAARGAKVVFSRGGIFHKSYVDSYQRATEKAEATYGLEHNFEPLFVHWIASEDVLRIAGGYLERACGCIFLATFLFALVAAPLTWILCRYFMQESELELEYGPY